MVSLTKEEIQEAKEKKESLFLALSHGDPGYENSFQWRLFLAYESAFLVSTSGKFKGVCREILALVPTEVRVKIGFQPVGLPGQSWGRTEKEQAWKDLEPINGSINSSIITTIAAYIRVPSGVDPLLKLWKEDNRQMAWQSLDVLKGFAYVYPVASGWNH